MSKKLYCSVFGCLNNSTTDPDLSFFYIPKNEPERRAQWLRLINREDLADRTKASQRICEKHFDASEIRIKQNRKLLLKNCLPSLNLPISNKDEKGTQCELPVPMPPPIVYMYWNCEASTQTDVNISDSTTQTTKALMEDKQLKAELARYKRRLTKLQTQKPSEKKQLDTYYNLCDHFLSKDLSAFVKAQTALRSSHTGNRYNLTYKMFCMNLFYVNPEAYRLLENTVCVPCRTTLNKMYSPMSTQINDELMTALKIKVNNMSARERNCSLVVAVMNLKPNLYYDVKKDKIIGFHEVDGVQTPAPAKHALVLIVKGFLVNWYQPIGYALLSERKSDENISKWIDKIIIKLFEIGLKVRAVVSEVGQDLINAARDKGVSVDQSYFTINEHKIYYIFDAPHLIKSVRNNFMTHDIHFQNGAVAKFEHVLRFFEYDQTRPFKQAHKLTNSHLKPNNTEKAKVSSATQLLSRSVATGLSTCIDFQIIDESGRITAEFVKMMNDLFDALNSSVSRHSYKPKAAFRGENHQVEFFNNMLYFFQTSRLINRKTGNDATKNTDFIEGFQITIKSILNLFEDLKREGFEQLLTKRLNCEVIENIVTELKSANNTSKEPTSRQFIYAFRRNFFSNIMKPPKEGRNADFSEFLVHLNYFKNECSEIDKEPDIFMAPQEKDLRDITCTDYQVLQIPVNNSFYYICGYLLKKSAELHKDCETFKLYMDENEPSNSSASPRFLRYRSLATEETANLLAIPPDDFVENIERMERVFQMAFQKEHLDSQIGIHILENMQNIEFILPCLCFPKEYLQKLFIRMRLYLALNSNNRSFTTLRNKQKPFVVSYLYYKY